MKKFLIFALPLVIALLGLLPPVYAGPITAKVNPKTTVALKEFMLRFGSEVISLEILRSKERRPDWDAIGETVTEMASVVAQMQQADKKGDYKVFTETLATYVAEMKTLSLKHSRKVFKVYNELSQTCMQCHAVNRTPDYIKH